MPRYCQVNDTDYAGRIVIEAQDWAGNWNVPAWEEQGHADLCGPFATWAEAFATLSKEADWDAGIAVYFMPERDCPAFD